MCNLFKNKNLRGYRMFCNLSVTKSIKNFVSYWKLNELQGYRRICNQQKTSVTLVQ